MISVTGHDNDYSPRARKTKLRHFLFIIIEFYSECCAHLEMLVEGAVS
jgi:hypothetical protein